MLTEVEELRARQNAASKEIGKAAPDDRPAKIAAAGALKEELTAREPDLAAAEAAVRALALAVPNPADADVPDGGEDEGDVLRTVGDAGPAPAQDHATFAEAMGFVDAERGAEVGGSRFAYVMREAVLLELALVQWVMGQLVQRGLRAGRAAGARARARDGGGRVLPDRPQPGLRPRRRTSCSSSARARCRSRRCTAASCSTPAALPRRYAGFSTNFRREAGTYGKDTRGIFRVHQFDKVEMFAFVAPADSDAEHERILAIEERIIGGLGLPYRVVNIAAGDLGPAAAKKFDIEVWLPSEGTYREATSCSNYRDFSARRLRTRVRGESRHRARAHAQRHRVRDQPDARVPLRALPAGRRLLRRPRRAPALHRLRHRPRPLTPAASRRPHRDARIAPRGHADSRVGIRRGAPVALARGRSRSERSLLVRQRHQVQEVPPAARRAGEAGRGRSDARGAARDRAAAVHRHRGLAPRPRRAAGEAAGDPRRDAQGRARGR